MKSLKFAILRKFKQADDWFSDGQRVLSAKIFIYDFIRNFDYYHGIGNYREMLPRKTEKTRKKSMSITWNWRVWRSAKIYTEDVNVYRKHFMPFLPAAICIKWLTKLKPKASQRYYMKWKGCKLANNRLESVSVCDGRLL